MGLMSGRAKFLVAYDGSDFSNRALKEALEHAKKFSGQVTVLNVCWEKSDDESRYMLKGAEKLLKEAGVKYALRSERDPNAPARILKIAKDEGFDYIVVGSRGEGRTREWLLGSVSSKVVAEAECPVIVTK